MFFALSKIFWSLAQPLNALALLAVIGLLMRTKWEVAGQRTMNMAVIMVVILGVLPIGQLMITYLERQYPAPKDIPSNIDGIIVLGGAFDSYLTAKTGQIVANSHIDRMLCFVALAQKNPNAKLVFSGGSGDILNPEAKESEDARMFFALVGLDKRQITYETKSRNTYENVLYTMDAVKPKTGERWVVTTSAYHMPRTMGIFNHFAWNVMPYACDPRTDGSYNIFSSLPSISDNFGMLSIALKEIIGGVVYFLTDKSAFILPPKSDRVGT